MRDESPRIRHSYLLYVYEYDAVIFFSSTGVVGGGGNLEQDVMYYANIGILKRS